MEKPKSQNGAKGTHRREHKKVSRTCQCGLCGGKTFVGHHTRKYHPDCTKVVRNRQSLEWNKAHPDKTRIASRKFMQTEKGRASVNRAKTRIVKVINYAFRRLHFEGIVHEFIAITIAWYFHFGEPLIIHDRRTLYPDMLSPEGSKVKEMDIYNPSRKLGYDIQSYRAFSDEKRKYEKEIENAERRRIAAKLGITLLELLFGKYQHEKCFEGQDCFSKVANAMSENNEVAPPSGMTEYTFKVEGVPMSSNMIIPNDDVHMPVFPKHVASSRNRAVAHPNKHVYVEITGDHKNEADFLRYSYVRLVNDLSQYISLENIETLKDDPDYFITEDERKHMDKVRGEVERIYTPEELSITLFAEEAHEESTVSGFIIKNRYAA